MLLSNENWSKGKNPIRSLIGLRISLKSKVGFNPANRNGPHCPSGNLYKLSHSLGKSLDYLNSGIDLKFPFKSNDLP
jgi:hypothetical protein